MAVGDHLSAVLFDLDNTLFDRDRAFMSWAEVFVQTRLAPQDDLRRREALGLLLSLDAHGYGSRPAMFATLKKTYPMCLLQIQRHDLERRLQGHGAGRPWIAQGNKPGFQPVKGMTPVSSRVSVASDFPYCTTGTGRNTGDPNDQRRGGPLHVGRHAGRPEACYHSRAECLMI